MNQLHSLIIWVRYQLVANALITCLLVASSAYLLMAMMLHSTGLGFLAALLGFGVAAYFSNLFADKKTQAIQLIHQRLTTAEYSLELLSTESPNIAEQLQLERLLQNLQGQKVPTIIDPKLWIYVVVFLVSLGIKWTAPLLKHTPNPTSKSALFSAQQANQKSSAPTFLNAFLTITPPAYTHLPVRVVSDLNLETVTGTQLHWKLKFSSYTALVVKLANHRGEELPFNAVDDGFEYKDQVYNSGLYGFKAYWHDSLVYQSDFYRIEVLPDLAPKIEPASKELYRYHFLKDPKTLAISAKISDDFLVNQAFIVATVARGSGENVKFREVKFPLSPTLFKEANLSKNIDLKALNFAPGDELYYYWAAIDNKNPEPNFTKSDTYFVVYKDTSNVEEAELATMAMNILPEYFRSQRQIIIDTEKLIAKRGKITAKEFNSTSNEIGFDQKALRLRYGQYLGEEFENSIGGGNALPKDNQGDAVVGFALLHGFIHAHDQGEPGAETGGHSHGGDGHDHSHGEAKKEDTDKDPVASILEEFVHSHDDGEANTFYEQSTRSLLKMALEQMWESELHLRLYEPEKAIPYEKKALEYLKSAQQRARTFVKKTGFDPPPIKEKEKRLTGELNNVNEGYLSEKKYTQQQVEHMVAEVLGIVEGYHPQERLSADKRLKVVALGNCLTSRVVNSRLSNWSVLVSLQKVASQKPLDTTEKIALKTKLHQLIGASSKGANSSYSTNQALQKAFWKNL